MQETYDILMSQALRYLSYRFRSIKEVQIFLEKKTTEHAAVAHVLTRLQEMNYLNDLTFAEILVSSYKGKRAKGPLWLARKLTQYGVESSIIDSVLQQKVERIEEDIGAVIGKKIKLVAGLPVVQQKLKLVSYLHSRGFYGEKVYRLVDEYVQNTYNNK